MESNSNLSDIISHFMASHRQQIHAAGDAFLSDDKSTFDRIVKRISESPLIKRVANMLDSASEKLDHFKNEMEKLIPGAKIVIGLTMVVAGFFLVEGLLTLLLVLAGILIAKNGVDQLTARRAADWLSDF